VVATAREEGAEVQGPPWPQTRSEVMAFASAGVEAVRIEEVRAPETLARWRALFRRPA
jgi:hypothetical protein